MIDETVINCAAYSDGRRVANLAIDDINEALKRPNQFVWIGLHEPGAEIRAPGPVALTLLAAMEDDMQAALRPGLLAGLGHVQPAGAVKAVEHWCLAVSGLRELFE